MIKGMFDVSEETIKVMGKVVPDRKAIVRTDTNEVIGLVGSDYRTVSTSTVLKNLKAVTDDLKMRWDIKKYSQIRGGSKEIVEIEFKDISMPAGSRKDMLLLRGHIINGYDGFSSARLLLGFYRLVCTNGMVIGTKEIELGYRHVGDVNNKLMNVLTTYTKTRVKTMHEKIQRMIAKTLTADQIDKIFEESDWLSQKYQKELPNAYSKEKIAPDGTLWKVYNSFTYVISHHMQVNAENKLNMMKTLNTHTDKLLEQ